MKYRSLRANNFQSTPRTSSPGLYARYSLNSTEAPCSGLRCRPLKYPSTTILACNCRFLICITAAGSIMSLVLAMLDRLQQLIDHVFNRQTFRFSFIAEQQSVAERRVGEFADVFKSDVGVTPQERPSFAAEDQRLSRPQARTPTRVLVDEIGGALAFRTRSGDQLD